MILLLVPQRCLWCLRKFHNRSHPMSHDDPDDHFRFNDANYHQQTPTNGSTHFKKKFKCFLAAITASSVLRSKLCLPGVENIPCRSPQAGWRECRWTTISRSFQNCSIGLESGCRVVQSWVRRTLLLFWLWEYGSWTCGSVWGIERSEHWLDHEKCK